MCKSKKKNQNQVKLCRTASPVSRKIKTDKKGACRRAPIDNEEDFTQAVLDSLAINMDYLSLDDLDKYTIDHYKTMLDPEKRKEIIKKVVSDEFLKGCMSARWKRGCELPDQQDRVCKDKTKTKKKK